MTGASIEKVTGRFSTREKLEKHCFRLRNKYQMTHKQISEDCQASVGTVSRILQGEENSYKTQKCAAEKRYDDYYFSQSRQLNKYWRIPEKYEPA